jgi:hypothetical protein
MPSGMAQKALISQGFLFFVGAEIAALVSSNL